MAIPALRQPKFIQQEKAKLQPEDVKNVILTLKSNRSLVVSSDAYNGILKGREMFRCVFCRSEMQPDNQLKEAHKVSNKHQTMMESFPHDENFAENLIRKLDKDSFYCTLCNVTFSTPFLAQHMSAEIHSQELQKAEIRVSAYKSSN